MDSIWKTLENVGDADKGVATITQAMEIERAGCIVRVYSSERQPGDFYNTSEGLVFVPWAKLTPTYDDENVPNGWKLISTGKF